jgi:molybdopterin-binding protein
VLRGTVVAQEGGSTTIELTQGPRLVVSGGVAGSAAQGGAALVAVRADDLMVAVDRPTGLSAQNIFAGTIREIRTTDPQDAAQPEHAVLVFVTIGPKQEAVVAAITNQSCRRLQLAAGQSVYLIVKAQSCRLLASR